MRVYKYVHSCLVVEEGEDKILFDPGINLCQWTSQAMLLIQSECYQEVLT